MSERDETIKAPIDEDRPFWDITNRTYGPLILIMIAVLLLMVGASSMGAHTEAKANIPDEVASYSQCEVTSKDTVRIRTITKEIITTSCGNFTIYEPLFSEVEEGNVYDFETRQPSWAKSPYVSKAIISSASN